MKIGVIGGAGVRTVIFINGLIKRNISLQIDTVSLYDINQEKLKIIAQLCQYVVRRNGGKLAVTIAATPEEAIEGADYMVTTLRVGGDHSRVIDEELALKHGVIGQETTGVGGFSMAVRTIPEILNYCRLIRKLAPQAWIFNFTNPSGLVTQAMHNAGFDKVIGICDAPSSTKFRMAEALAVDEKNLYVEYFGLNHLSWISSVQKYGEEILPELIRDEKFLQSIQEFSMFDSQIIRDSGLLPNEYLYYYDHREKALHNILESGCARGKTIEQVNRNMLKELGTMDIEKTPEEALQTFLYYMQVRENSYMSTEAGIEKRPYVEKGKLEVPDGIGYAGVMLDCIEGMQSKEGRSLVLSVKNNGAIPFLKDEDVVEITCNVSEKGIIPVAAKNIPEDCKGLICLIKAYERLTVEAIEKKDAGIGARALAIHPLVNSYSIARELVKDYTEAYGKLF